MLLRTASFAIASSLALGAPAAYAGPDVPVAVETVTVTAPQSSQADATGYAERDRQDTRAANFEGGDMLIIGMSGGVLLVLLALLIIL